LISFSTSAAVVIAKVSSDRGGRGVDAPSRVLTTG
jgi:hypothetical protein